jgi:drug/metabolite transporter (DMT)-like permease
VQTAGLNATRFNPQPSICNNLPVSRSLKAHLLLLFLTFVWGSTFVLVKSAFFDCTPQLFNALRFSFSAALLAWIYRRHLANLSRATLGSGVVIGVFLCVGYQFQNAGLRLTTPSKSAFLTGLSVVLVPVFLALGWGRKINGWTLAGVVSAFAGLYLLTIPQGGTHGLGELNGVNLGDLLTLGCAAAFALQMILLGRVMQKHRFQQIVVVEITTCALLMAASTPLLEQPRFMLSATVWWALGITVLLSTVIGFAAQAWAQQFTPPTHAALIFALEPVFALVTSYLLEGERFGLRAGIGATLILGGVLVSELLGLTHEPQAGLAEV